MSFTLRALRVPTDFARLAELFSTIDPEPTTAEELARWHEVFPQRESV